MVKTWRERFEIALKLRGKTQEFTTSSKYLRYTRKEGGSYFLGKSGSLRYGNSRTDSIPVSDKFKQHLLELTMEKVLSDV